VKLQNTVTIAAPPDEVFKFVNDVERVATCVPGATLLGREDDVYTGAVKIKVGPISAAYTGKLRFVTVDESARRLVMDGRGADSHGNGDAQAHVELVVDEVAEGSRLRVDTDLVLSGKIVAFGKHAIVAVSDKVMGQFAANLAAQLAPGGPVPHAGSTVAPHLGPGGAPTVVHTPQSRTEADMADGGLDVLSMVPPGARRVATGAAIFFAGVVEGWLITRAFGKR
jgi:carbon monoxide dehydrogenase subunit G